MGGLSTTQEIDNPICPCQQGNLFLCRLPLDAPALSFSVNGNDTGALPTDLIYRLENTLEGTTSRLSFTHLDSGREITLIEDLDQFTQNRPEDVGVFIGTEDQLPPTPSAPPTESRLDRARRLLRTRDMPSPVTYGDELSRLERIINSGNADNDTHAALDNLLTEIENHAIANGYIDPPTGEEDLYALEVPAWIQPYISEGEFNFEDFTEEQIRPYAIAIASGLRLIDDATGLQALADMTGGSVDFTVAGTNTVPLAVELVDMLSRGQNRAFLRDVIRMGATGRIGKIWRNANGTLLLSFRGNAGLRPFLSGTVYGVANAKVSVISSAVQNSRQWAGVLRSVGGRIPVISYVIVGAFDVAEWLAQPAAERELSDLAGQLIVDISKVALATIAGAAVGAALIALGTAGVIASLPIIAIVAAGIGASIVAGVLLDMADARWGITQKVKDFAGEAGPSIEQFMQRREQDISVTDSELYEGMMTAP